MFFGFGVLFEVFWEKFSELEKEEILIMFENGLK